MAGILSMGHHSRNARTDMLLRLQNGAAAMTNMVRQQERTANDLANINTIGYRRERSFTETLHQHLDAEGTPTSVRETRHWTDASQGMLEPTGNSLDFALSGDGFFVVEDENGGTRLTRAGRFILDEDRVVRDIAGMAVQGRDGVITVPDIAGQIEVSERGEIRIGNQVVGQFRIANVSTAAALQRIDGAGFITDEEPFEVEQPSVRQGYVELSNVSPISAMVEMMEQFRLYESHQKLIQTSDQLLGRATNELGKF